MDKERNFLIQKKTTKKTEICAVKNMFLLDFAKYLSY